MSSVDLPSLLLLPPAPSPASPAAWKAAYLPSLTATLLSLRDLKKPGCIVLEVLIACPKLYNRMQEPRAQIFQEAEQILAGVYSLICSICAQNSIEADGPGGIDPRLILATYDNSQQVLNDSEPPSQPATVAGPIIDLHSFALTRRRWEHVYSIDGEEGGDILKRYMTIVRLVPFPFLGEMHTVTGGISMVSPIEGDSQTSDGLNATHTTAAVGGTFDHLHAGHKLLLTATALLLQPAASAEVLPRRLIVGITGDELLKNKKYAEQLQSWEQRHEKVLKFLMTILNFTKSEKDNISTTSFNEPVVNGRAVHTHLKQAALTIECVEIQDPFGPTITDESVSALVVSGETRSGGSLVNEKRQEKGWKPLEVFEVDVLNSQLEEQSSGDDNFASKISSTAIRKRKAEATNGSLHQPKHSL